MIDPRQKMPMPQQGGKPMPKGVGGALANMGKGGKMDPKMLAALMAKMKKGR